MDEVLRKHIDVLIQDCKDKDDALIVIFGDEGAGKSVLESQIVKYISNQTEIKFSIKENVHFVGTKLISSALEGVRLQINCLDESRRTLNKMRMSSGINQNFMDFLSECRSNNQFNIILLPNYFDLDEDVAVRRPKLVLKVLKKRHPVTKKLIRGNFQILNLRDKNKLKWFYKKKLDNIPKSMIVYEGKFDKQMGWDEKEYEEHKEEEKKENFLNNTQQSRNYFTDSQIKHIKWMSNNVMNPYNSRKDDEKNDYKTFYNLQKRLKNTILD